MTKRIIGFLLALCLIVGLLPVMALAEEANAPTATLTVASGSNSAPALWSPKMTVGMAPAYAKTVDGLITTEGASEADYNLRAEWPTGGKPTLTLKDATINNNNVYPNKKDTIAVGGTADIDIVLQGTNTLNCYPANSESPNYKISAYRCPFGISAENTGMLTVRGTNKATDKLAIHSWGGNGVARRLGPMTIEKADFNIQVYKDANASSYSAHGITLMCGDSAAYVDKTNLTVCDSNLTINMHKNPGAKIIVVGVGNDEASSTNTSDILFKNSVIYFNRNNSSGQSSAAISHGSGTTVTFDRCVRNYLYAWRVMFTYMPTILNYTTATYSEEISSSSAKTYDYDPAKAGDKITVRTVTWTHECLPGEPFIEKHAAECTTKQYEVTKCVVCDKETSRVEQEITDPAKIHTPGAKVELADQRTDADFVYTSDAKTHYKIQSGKYVFQHTCTACGETWTTEESFQPAILYYITKGAGGTNNNANANTNTKVGYKGSNVRLYNPGTTIYYKTVVGTDTNNSGNSYMHQTTNADAIAAGDWTVKFEYPVGGTPVLTLKDATIINNEGLWYGFAGWRNVAPLTIVLEGKNTIAQTHAIQGSGPLMFLTSNGVTITGDGSLNLVTYNAGHALYSTSNLTLDDVDISVTRPQSHATSTRGYAIGSTADITINGGSLDVTSLSSIDVGTDKNGNPTYTTYSGFYAAVGGKNVAIKDANITAQGAFHPNYGILYSTGNMTISESSLLLAHGFVTEEHLTTHDTNAITCKGTLTWDYKNGMVGKTIHTDENSLTVFDSAVNPNITYPAGITNIVENENMSNAALRNYLQLAPGKALANFTGTSVTVNDDLDVNFKLDVDKVDQGGTVKFTVDGVETTKPLSTVGVTSGNDYIITLPGLTAKEMAKEITVTIYDSNGDIQTVTKSDSVQAYALRLLRGSAYAADTEINRAMKTFVVDMLIYGSMAQVQFGSKDETLVTNVLTATEWGYATATDPVVEATPAVPSGEGYVGTTFVLKSNIGMGIALNAKVLPEVTNAVVTFTDYKGEEKSVSIMKKDASSSSGYTIFIMNELTAANGRQEITWNFCDAGGNVKLTVTDSLANYVGRMRGAYPYTDELLKYCDSAEAYFSLLNELAKEQNSAE